MTGYLLPLCCPRCGKPVEHVQSSRPCAGTEASALVRCSGAHCRYEWQVMVHLRPVGKVQTDRSQPCGTSAGYREHLRRGEQACSDCTDANTRRQIDFKASRKKVGA